MQTVHTVASRTLPNCPLAVDKEEYVMQANLLTFEAQKLIKAIRVVQKLEALGPAPSPEHLSA